MKDPQGSPVQGGTRWRRFAALFVPSAALAGAVVFGMANGAIAASFDVSGDTFKVAASKLEGTGFEQYGGVVKEKDGTLHAVAVSEIQRADIHDLCQSVKQTAPLIGTVVLRIEAGGGGTPASAQNLLIDMAALDGNATFTNIQIGRDAADLGGMSGFFGQDADGVTITDLKQVAWSTSAGTFNLTGLKLRLHVGDSATSHECFADLD
ncbi:MAG TPA: DUF6230 family protein [Micromonosporaceae bacterium]